VRILDHTSRVHFEGLSWRDWVWICVLADAAGHSLTGSLAPRDYDAERRGHWRGEPWAVPCRLSAAAAARLREVLRAEAPHIPGPAAGHPSEVGGPALRLEDVALPAEIRSQIGSGYASTVVFVSPRYSLRGKAREVQNLLAFLEARDGELELVHS